jgi:hypothetical protein
MTPPVSLTLHAVTNTTIATAAEAGGGAGGVVGTMTVRVRVVSVFDWCAQKAVSGGGIVLITATDTLTMTACTLDVVLSLTCARDSHNRCEWSDEHRCKRCRRWWQCIGECVVMNVRYA